MQETYIWTYRKMVYLQTRHSIQTRPILTNKRKIICQFIDFSVPAYHWMKMKYNKYLNLSREIKMKEMLIPILIGAYKTDAENLGKILGEQEISGRIETILTLEFLKPPRIFRKLLELTRLVVSQTTTKYSVAAHKRSSRDVRIKILIGMMWSAVTTN